MKRLLMFLAVLSIGYVAGAGLPNVMQAQGGQAREGAPNPNAVNSAVSGTRDPARTIANGRPRIRAPSSGSSPAPTSTVGCTPSANGTGIASSGFSR